MIMEEYDDLEIYCRKLGHHITFSYCQEPGSEKVCSSVRDCWYGRIDIDEYLENRYSPEELKEALKPGLPKITGIMEVLARLSKDKAGT